MSTPVFFLHELKKQASSFLKENIRNARLALTDVTPAQLLAEEATAGNPWPPGAMTMRHISRAAFEIDDCCRIVDILHKRFEKFDTKNWREAYNSLILLEHLLAHGPESTAAEFQSDREVLLKLGAFKYIDQKGFNWGLCVRKKSERVLKLLEKGPLWKEERERARRISLGIQGFGSFSLIQPSSINGVNASAVHPRSQSLYEDHNWRDVANTNGEKENLKSDDDAIDALRGKSSRKSSYMKVHPLGESKPLLACACACEELGNNELTKEVQHPFSNFKAQQIGVHASLSSELKSSYDVVNAQPTPKCIPVL